MGHRRVEPTGHHLAVAVDELHELDLGRDPLQSVESFVAGPCGSERGRQVEAHDLGAHRCCERHGVVGRVRVDVHQRSPGRVE